MSIKRPGIQSSLLAVALGFLGSSVEPAAQVFVVGTDFSATSNPSGAWAYGWSETLNGAFVLDTAVIHSFFNGFVESAVGVDAWVPTGSGDTSPPTAHPHVSHNGTTSDIAYNTSEIVWRPGDVEMHPGEGGQYAVVRWTAPWSGPFDLRVSFEGMNAIGTTTDVHVSLNGAELSSGAINGYQSSYVSQRTGMNLIAGDVLDFAVGYGANQTFFYDSTRFSAQITAVPEPADLATVTGVLLSGGAMVLRRRRACRKS